jgi:hypothetical protein
MGGQGAHAKEYGYSLSAQVSKGAIDLLRYAIDYIVSTYIYIGSNGKALRGL